MIGLFFIFICVNLVYLRLNFSRHKNCLWPFLPSVGTQPRMISMANAGHRPYSSGMHLEQGQVWKQGNDYFRIVTWERLAIEYKAMKDLDSKEGTLHQATKKEFCRLIKGAVLQAPQSP